MLKGDLKSKDIEMQNETDDEQGSKETSGDSKDELAQEDVEIRQDDDEDARNDSTNDAQEADEENKSTSRNGTKTIEIGEVDIVPRFCCCFRKMYFDKSLDHEMNSPL
jgi:uncharacterized membrane protein YdbT with pleckstrin-like domain